MTVYTHTHTHISTHTHYMPSKRAKWTRRRWRTHTLGIFEEFVFVNSVFCRCINSKPQSLAPKSVDQISLSGLSHIVIDRGLRRWTRELMKKSDWPCPKSQPSLHFPNEAACY